MMQRDSVAGSVLPGDSMAVPPPPRPAAIGTRWRPLAVCGTLLTVLSASVAAAQGPVYVASGASVIAIPAAFTKTTGEAHWHVLLRARAIETGSFVIAAAQGGHHEDGRDTFGHSMIIDPWGRILAEASTEPGVILAAIDPAESADARARIPALANRRDFAAPVAAPAKG